MYHEKRGQPDKSDVPEQALENLRLRNILMNDLLESEKSKLEVTCLMYCKRLRARFSAAGPAQGRVF